MGIFRLAVKIGLAGGAVYFMKKEGVWNNSEISLQTLERLKQASQPHLDQIKEHIPLDLPKIPQTEQIHHLVGIYWNRGVLTTFNFLQHLPTHILNWSNKGLDMALQNEEIKKFIDSLKLSETSK